MRAKQSVEALEVAPEVLSRDILLPSPCLLHCNGDPAEAVALRVNNLMAKRAFHVEERAEHAEEWLIR